MEGEPIFGVELNYVFGVEEGEEIVDSIFAAELPVAADLTEAEKDFEKVSICIERFTVGLALLGLALGQ